LAVGVDQVDTERRSATNGRQATTSADD
jgi:hypothetical protein